MESSKSALASAARVWPVALFTSVYLVGALMTAVQGSNYEFLLYIGVVVLMMGVVWVVHGRVALTSGALWCLSIWGLAHMAGGLVVVPESWPVMGTNRVLYSLWLIPDRLKYDHVVHAYGFGVTTWVCWQGLRAALGGRHQRVRPTPGLMLLCAAAGLGFGALNEVIEFAATLLVPETNVGGYLNTGWDLVANLFGATVAVTAIWISDRSTSPEETEGR
ncbi:MAG: DUF2238 domain-containing protein [Acidobacteriota bacterium]